MELRDEIAYNIIRTAGHVLSDKDLKMLCDHCDLKNVAGRIMAESDKFGPLEALLISRAVGNMDDDHDFERDGDNWEQYILDKYAEYVHNYEYTYKPEAQQLDPSIDPDEKHIGPMAQDLEKVNPATVVEDKETGYKEVDTGRLALMNAGAIAELARAVKELQNGR